MTGAAPVPFAAVAQDHFHPQRFFNADYYPVY
jgi:hypothetical protein